MIIVFPFVFIWKRHDSFAQFWSHCQGYWKGRTCSECFGKRFGVLYPWWIGCSNHFWFFAKRMFEFRVLNVITELKKLLALLEDLKRLLIERNKIYAAITKIKRIQDGQKFLELRWTFSLIIPSKMQRIQQIQLFWICSQALLMFWRLLLDEFLMVQKSIWNWEMKSTIFFNTIGNIECLQIFMLYGKMSPNWSVREFRYGRWNRNVIQLLVSCNFENDTKFHWKGRKYFETLAHGVV